MGITGTEVVPVTIPRGLAAISVEAPALFVPGARAAERFFGIVLAKIRNKNTRRAYHKAECHFAECARAGI
jgi:hypothetical protein